MKARRVVWIATVMASCALGASAGTVNMEYVLVGNPGNPADDTGWGRVDHSYLIGKYEVTNAQYIAFLNAVAVSDTYGLYNAEFETEKDGGIARTGSEGSYTYGPKDGDSNWLNRPVTRATFWDACRFANWLHNGQPTGAQGPGTTEDGPYTLNGYIGSDGREITHNEDARVWIPTEDEWYKAAYYDPALNGGSGGYWKFPTGTNSLLNNNPPSQDTGDSANFGLVQKR